MEVTKISQSKPVKVTVQTKPYPEHSPTGVLSINPQMLQILKLRAGTITTLVFGRRKTKVQVETSNHHKQLILIDDATANHLSLPDGIHLNLSYHPKINSLFLGPLFCILVDPVEKPTDGPVRSLTPFIEAVTRYGQKKGTLVFVASPSGVNPDKQQVTGWHLFNRAWQAREFPIPDVCYNRISSRTIEQAQQTQAIVQFLNKTCHFFNTQFLNKWQVHQHLSKSNKVRHYLPETRPYESSSNFKDMLQTYSTVYLKPTNGSLGRGVIRLARHSHHITCQYATVSGNVSKKFKNPSQLMQFLKPRVTRQDYLVQQGLKLAGWANRPVDFRILAQKDGTGKWRVTSMVARAAQENTVVTNIARGGNLYSVKSILPHLTSHSAEYTQRRLRQLAILVAQELEAQLEGTYAEFGIDLAMDIHNNLWLLEVNAKPSKDEDSLLGKDANRPSVRYLLQYVSYATEKQRNITFHYST